MTPEPKILNNLKPANLGAIMCANDRKMVVSGIGNTVLKLSNNEIPVIPEKVCYSTNQAVQLRRRKMKP